MRSLSRLDLSGNRIRDLSALIDNPGIGSGERVYLEGNPLSEHAISVQIPELEARGVEVLGDYSTH